MSAQVYLHREEAWRDNCTRRLRRRRKEKSRQQHRGGQWRRTCMQHRVVPRSGTLSRTTGEAGVADAMHVPLLRTGRPGPCWWSQSIVCPQCSMRLLSVREISNRHIPWLSLRMDSRQYQPGPDCPEWRLDRYGTNRYRGWSKSRCRDRECWDLTKTSSPG